MVEATHEAVPVPTVTVVLPTLDERPFIRDCLDSLCAQDYPAIIEILVADGGSSDGTRDIIAAMGGSVRVVDNPGGTAAAGMNAGLAAAKGDVICRADAHSLYAADYVSRCVDALLDTGAQNVGGPMVPVGTTAFGRAVAAATTTPVGVGPGAFHFMPAERVEVDTVYLGTFWTADLRELGGYDAVGIQWAAEDHELNLRLRAAGGRIVLDPRIRSVYFPRDSPGGLARQYHNYGLGKVSTLRKHRTLPSWRPAAPALLVVGTLGLLVLGRSWPLRLALPGVHAAALAAVAVRLSRDPGVAPHRAFAALWICHWTYGLGLLRGAGRALLGRPPDLARR